jgi:hypothetical protein
MIDEKKVEKEILSIIESENLFDIDTIFAYYKGCSKSTFYSHDLHELDSIKSALENNRLVTKQDLKKKWFESENPTVQIALFKLIATPDERKNLSQNYTDVTTAGKEIKQIVQIGYGNKDD